MIKKELREEDHRRRHVWWFLRQIPLHCSLSLWCNELSTALHIHFLFFSLPKMILFCMKLCVSPQKLLWIVKLKKAG
jgi:hypothetical protein